MPLPRRCTEFPYCEGGKVPDGLLRDKPRGTKTCSERCKTHRARRIKRSNALKGQHLPEGLAEVSEVVTKGARDAAHEVLQDELRPIVREMLTEDVLHSISTLVGLTPRAIEKLTEHLESSDETISQRAYTLLMKYTLGNPSVAPPPSTPQAGGLNVVFNVPRPGDSTAPEVVVPEPDEAAPLRECADCSQSKTEAEFVAGSDRCQECFDGMRGMLVERFGDVYKP